MSRNWPKSAVDSPLALWIGARQPGGMTKYGIFIGKLRPFWSAPRPRRTSSRSQSTESRCLGQRLSS